MTDRDWGVVFELDGAAMLTSYVAPALVDYSQFAGRVQRRRYSLFAQLKASGTDVTGVKLKVQASADGTDWYDVESTDDASGTVAVEHDFTAIVSHTITASVSLDAGFAYLRAAMKADGGVGQATETFAVSMSDFARGSTVAGAQIDAGAVGAVAIDAAALRLLGGLGKDASGGAQAADLAGALVGDVVLGVVDVSGLAADVSASFEPTITVADQLQQSATDLGDHELVVSLLRRGA